MFTIFVVGAVATLPGLGDIRSLADFWTVLDTKVFTGVAPEGFEKLGFWHIMFFAWFCNLAMHVDLSDMAVFRYAKSWRYGLYSAFGMFPGHFMAWLASGIMVAAIGLKMSPGQMAVNAAGLAGAVAVVVAGWTTANPTMYRSGLALQTVTPNWPRWAVTLTAGVVTTILSCFPFFFMRLLDFVAIYGLILMPVGAAVFAEFWLIPRLGIRQYRAEQRGWFMSYALLGSWAITLAACYFMPIHLFYRWLPGYFIALGLYLGLAFVEDRLRPAVVAAAAGGVS